jgi:tetratricopeptide (TPR) repeat protein
MKIIRWLLSHAFLILVIVAVIYCYMFWGNLAGKDTPVGKGIAYLSDEFVEVKEFVDAVNAKQAKLEGERPPAGNEQVRATTEVAVTSSEQTSSAETVISDAEQQPVSIIYSHNNNRVEQNSVAPAAKKPMPDASDVADSQPIQNSVDSQSVSQGQKTASMTQPDTLNAVAVNEAREVFVSPDLEKQLDQVDGSGKVIVESQQTNSVRDTWVTARKAYYQRNYELSEQSYQKVIDSTEDNFDAYGELGNVYFNQGKNEQAASVYFEAAAIMVRKGQVNRARSLMGLLRHLDKSKADELQKLIDSDSL